jgi:hypothetical protein
MPPKEDYSGEQEEPPDRSKQKRIRKRLAYQSLIAQQPGLRWLQLFTILMHHTNTPQEVLSVL